MADELDTEIALEAKDLLPETWDALTESQQFGEPALIRRYNRVVERIFGVIPTDTEQAAMNSRVIEYAGKSLAYRLLDPAIDYWSKQVISLSAGDRESKTYKDRVEDLKQLKKDWPADLAAMIIDIGPVLPPIPGRVQDPPRVVQAGQGINTEDNPRPTGNPVVHTSPYPYDLEPPYGPP